MLEISIKRTFSRKLCFLLLFLHGAAIIILLYLFCMGTISIGCALGGSGVIVFKFIQLVKEQLYLRLPSSIRAIRYNASKQQWFLLLAQGQWQAAKLLADSVVNRHFSLLNFQLIDSHVVRALSPSSRFQRLMRGLRSSAMAGWAIISLDLFSHPHKRAVCLVNDGVHKAAYRQLLVFINHPPCTMEPSL